MFLYIVCFFSFQARRPGRMIKSKPYVDDEEPVEGTSTTVSESVVEGVNHSNDDSVCFS
jgi:hypothetical protein